MDRSIPFRKTFLGLLPIEVKLVIMSALPDVWSLTSTALTCSSLYRILADNEALLTSKVLLNETNFDILPEAVAALESSRLKPWTRQHIRDFTFQHLHARKLPTQRYALSDALHISKLYYHVRYFAVDFASKTLAKRPVSGHLEPTSAPPSQAELTRIQRAFYRFEIYCNLFRDPERTLFSVAEQRDVFFSCFSPWENEQLACIHDYLFRVVSPAFNDIAEHDIEWGEFSVEYGDRIDSQFVQHLLSLSLASLHRIVMANTYEERYKLLYSDFPPYNSEFLFEGLKEANERDDAVYLSDYTQDVKLAHVALPFVDDPDDGPADAWSWAHQDETCVNFVNSDSRKPLREWGYVMWDRARLENWAIFETPWEGSEASVSANEESQSWGEMQASFDQRSKIYLAGGRGWWSLGDESNIIWPGGRSPRDSTRWTKRHVQVKSLGEALDFLSSLKYSS